MNKKLAIIIVIVLASLVGATAALAAGVNVYPNSGHWNFPGTFKVENNLDHSIRYHLDCRPRDPNYEACKKAGLETEGNVAAGGEANLGMGHQCFEWQLDIDYNGDGIDDVGYVAEAEGDCYEEPEIPETPVIDTPKKPGQPEGPNTDGCIIRLGAEYANKRVWDRWQQGNGVLALEVNYVDQTVNIIEKDVIVDATIKFPRNYSGIRGLIFTSAFGEMVKPADGTPVVMMVNLDTCEKMDAPQIVEGQKPCPTCPAVANCEGDGITRYWSAMRNQYRYQVISQETLMRDLTLAEAKKLNTGDEKVQEACGGVCMLKAYVRVNSQTGMREIAYGYGNNPTEAKNLLLALGYEPEAAEHMANRLSFLFGEYTRKVDSTVDHIWVPIQELTA